MIAQTDSLADLYDSDETAWLESMSQLIREGRTDELDFHHLSEYLLDMARRDRREVESRLALFFAHLLKWDHQPEKHSGSWRATIVRERQELETLVSRGVLRNHAEARLSACYKRGMAQAAAETGLPVETFPGQCPWTLDNLLQVEK
jgi:hypothetical protein